MPDKEDIGTIYYRSKSDAVGALAVGCILLVFALLVLTQDEIEGISFSEGLVAMSTYLALPLGVVMVLVNIRHVVSKGPTVVAGKEGIIVVFTREPVGPFRWSEIAGFKPFKHQGKWILGITLENPDLTFHRHKGHLSPLRRRGGPAEAHIRIHGKMLDGDVKKIAGDLEEMRQLYSWLA